VADQGAVWEQLADRASKSTARRARCTISRPPRQQHGRRPPGPGRPTGPGGGPSSIWAASGWGSTSWRAPALRPRLAPPLRGLCGRHHWPEARPLAAAGRRPRPLGPCPGPGRARAGRRAWARSTASAPLSQPEPPWSPRGESPTSRRRRRSDVAEMNQEGLTVALGESGHVP
jgi:hypothetical protein